MLGCQTGAVAIAIANPTDLVKVRLQAEGKLPPGVPRRYSGALNAYSTIVRQVKSFIPITLSLSSQENVMAICLMLYPV